MIRALLIALALCASPLALGADHGRLADAIRAAEGYRGRPGALGEEGPYQLRAITWRQHMQPHCSGAACGLCRDFATDDGRELRTNPGPRARGNGAALPFALARDERFARACALKHLAWLSRSLEARGVPATPFNLAAAWNAGLERYLSGRAPERAYAYARRVEALYLGASGQNTLKSPAAISSRRRAGVVVFITRGEALSSRPPLCVRTEPCLSAASDLTTPVKSTAS